MAQRSFFAKLFGLNESETIDENRSEDLVKEDTQEEEASPSLQDAINFIVELLI